jgi:hypothetical protein
MELTSRLNEKGGVYLPALSIHVWKSQCQSLPVKIIAMTKP